MQLFVTKLKNFPDNPFSESYTHTQSPYELQTLTALSNEIISILNDLELSTDKISIFRSYDFCEHPIHRDNHTFTDMAKLIWMWGEKYEMIWYNLNNSANEFHGKKIGPNGVNSSYINYDKMDASILHKEVITGPSIIQVGIPHNVINYSGNRISCTVVPFLTKNNKLLRPITYSEALNIFKKYLD